MKLGDSMAPIEACNVWNDVCPRKTRPPKIGDIPRHVAVDEESPGSSSARLLGRISEVPRIPENPMLHSKSLSRKHPASSSRPPHLETSPSSSESPQSPIDRVPRSTDKANSPRDNSLEHSSRSSVAFNGPMYDEIRETSGADRPMDVSEKRACVEVFSSIGDSDRKLYEEAVAEGVIEVRKDSALYIDERALESLVSPGVNSRLAGPGTRRESSGYFSNLGTFDEDRWTSSPMEQASLQEATRDSLQRERRRSSTKNNRLPASNHQHVASGQQVNRPSLIGPTSEETNLSSSENDAPANATAKSGRLEMPNIDEQPSLETNKCSEKAEEVIEAEFANKLSVRSSPVRDEDSWKIEEANRSEENGEDAERVGKSSNESSTQWSSPRAGAANRQRRRMVVHQCSSPNITNSELERIVEKPYGEKLPSGESKGEARSSVAERLGETDDEDDDEQVVVARHDREESEDCRDKVDGEARKLLPRSVKVYQLLSTQSEDRGDGDARLFDRRISLQIPRNEEEVNARVNDCPPLPKVCSALGNEYPEEKKLVHADSVPIIKIPSLVTSTVEGELRLCAGEHIPGSDIPTGPAIGGIRPIYPYCPYSPYASPQGSPRTNRRRPLRESRRVSIDSRQGALQLNQYKLLNNIGQGSYGIVKLAYNEEDDTHYAMKILSKKKLMKKAGIFGRIAPGRKGVTNPLAKVYREIALLKKLDHPNVVKLVEVLDDPDEDNLYLVFELVQKGEVMQLPTDKPLDEETARRHFRDVVMGVEYLHYQRIVHRDIKPSNLLLDSDGRVKVADLGVSAELRAAGELLSGSAGTPAFAAPETTTPGAQYSGTLCDVWSMGVTLYSLVTGKVPWDGAGSIIGVQAAVRSEPLRFPEKPQLSDSLRDLISRMLAKDPTRRISLAEIKEHHWLTKNGEEPLPNEADNCRLPVTVTDEEVARVVTRVPKLDTLILIKTMLKQHSFQNPFLPRRIVRPGCTSGEPVTSGVCLKQQAISTDITDPSTKSPLPAGETLKSKTQQFHKAGRSNSAPDSYEWQTNGRQISNESMLPPVTESSSQEAEVENR